MVGDDDARAEQAGERRQKRRADGMEMDDLGAQDEAGIENARQRARDALEIFVARVPEALHPHAGKVEGLPRNVAVTGDDRELVVGAQRLETRIDLLAMGLDTPHHARNATKANH
jgi:hypothetical protein